VHTGIAVLRQEGKKVVPFNKVNLARLASFCRRIVWDSRQSYV
jgi:hypothetical protein